MDERERDDSRYGTHQRRSKPEGGWPNTKEPEESPRRRIRKARKKLDARRAAWDQLRDQRGRKRPGSLKIR